MASPPIPTKTSKWGSFISQAVAGVESTLDTILADADEAPVKSATTGGQGVSRSSSRGPIAASKEGRTEDNLARILFTNSRKHDRLQERLARAMVRKDQATRLEESPNPSLHGRDSGTASSVSRLDSPRSSAELNEQGHGSRSQLKLPGEVPRSSAVSLTGGESSPEMGSSAGQLPPPRISLSTDAAEVEGVGRVSIDSQPILPPQVTVENSLGSPELPSLSQSPEIDGLGMSLRSVEDYEALVRQLRSDHEIAELRRQDETHIHMERIDALQTKLLYLSKEMAESARVLLSVASEDEVKLKLAEKDEQIALLMIEGQKLSMSELKHMTAIKKFRTAAKEQEKVTGETQKKLQKVERELIETREGLWHVETLEKRASEKIKSMSKLQYEIETLKREREDKASTIGSLHSQLKQANNRVADAAKQVQSSSLEAEKKVVLELRDDLSSLKIEKELGDERARAALQDVKEKAERDSQRARATETELQAEQAMLESKIEVLRARVEEASTGATGDAQAKLLRQIETLQTQYAVASENWQGIEASIMSRVTSLEREKDELTRREADMRRKAREIIHKSKHLEETVEISSSQVSTLEADLLETQRQIESLNRRLSDSEAALKEARIDLAREKEEFDTILSQRLIQERTRLQHELATHPRTESPTTALARHANPLQHGGSSSDFLSLSQVPNTRTRPTSSSEDLPTPIGLPSEFASRSWSRRSSSRPEQLLRQDSYPSTLAALESESPLSPTATTQHGLPCASNRISRAPSNPPSNATSPNPSSSVALLSNLSLSIRRLESEKSSYLDDISRLTAQLTEAKEEVGKLMTEVEEKRKLEARVVQITKEASDVQKRYDQVLVMLGERTEQVEELKGDVAELKGIYRELVETIGETTE